MEQLLNRATTLSDLAFLRVMQLSHIQTSALVEDLKTYELSAIAIAPRGTPEWRLAQLQSTGLAAVGSGGVVTMSAMLEAAMDELFMPYTEGQRYLDRESKSLSELYAGRLALFTRYHVSLCIIVLMHMLMSIVCAGEGPRRRQVDCVWQDDEPAWCLYDDWNDSHGFRRGGGAHALRWWDDEGGPSAGEAG